MEAVEKKVVKKLCKNCKSYLRKNSKTGRCELSKSTRKPKGDIAEGVILYVNKDNNWTCEKFAERV